MPRARHPRLHLEVERANARAQNVYRRQGFVDHDRYLLTKRLVGVPGPQLIRRRHSVSSSHHVTSFLLARSQGEADARPAPPPPPPRPADATLRDLVDVLAVAQSVHTGSTTFSLLSVERYADGFVAQFRVGQEYSPDACGQQQQRFPELVCEATDDRTGRYTAWPTGGSGSAGQGLRVWRLAYRFAPALDHAAQELRLIVVELVWRAHALMPVEAERAVGPWTFPVPLPPGAPA